MDNIDSKSHKMGLKSSIKYSTNQQSQHHATSYLWPLERTYIHTHTYTYLDKSIISKNQGCASLQPPWAWFKNIAKTTCASGKKQQYQNENAVKGVNYIVQY